MYALSPDDNAKLAQLNSTYSTKKRGETYFGMIVCKVTKKVYAEWSGKGVDEETAVHNAIQKALTATKPYAEAEATEIKSLRSQITELEAKLDAANSDAAPSKPAKPPKPGKGVVPAPLDKDEHRRDLKRILFDAGIAFKPTARTSTLEGLVTKMKVADAEAKEAEENADAEEATA